MTSTATQLRVTDWTQPAPQLQVTLHKDHGNLPASVHLILPEKFALRLIHQRLASPVADFNTYADAELNADDLKLIGFSDADLM